MGKYRLAKSKKIFFQVYRHFQKKKKNISSAAADQLRSVMSSLQTALIHQNRKEASDKAKELASLAHLYLKRPLWRQLSDFSVGLGVALAIAVLVRQTWFELYEIPTGSMRPTFKEQDRLAVTKTSFGVNIPLTTGHAYFNPDLIARSGVVIFTVQDMDFRDGDTIYFYLFPGKKLLIKRMIGKPGDTVYFYGGKIYGIDKDGNDISAELQIPELNKIEHIPFIHFEGKILTTPSSIPGVSSPVMLYQMNQPVARLHAQNGIRSPRASGELLPKTASQDPSMRYDNLWGFEHFATSRLLTKDQVRQFTDQDADALEEASLYLELKHHPSLKDARIGYDEWNRVRPMIGLSTSIIPLKEEHLRAIFDNLYTSRFVVSKGFAHRYGTDTSRAPFFPHFPGVPDGTYEFYYGKAYEVKMQGVTIELSPSHPIYRFDPSRIQTLFNIGMEFDTRYSPQSREQTIFPSRYAYFREGDLYLMGAPVLKSTDSSLNQFVLSETAKEETAPSYKPYYGFIDRGPPLLPNGQLNTDLVRKYGLVVPPKSYLVLGDNHANSGDSREFGFVPEENLRGSPSFIFWPPGSRFGTPNQPSYALLNPGRLTIWGLAVLGFGGWSLYQRRRHKLPLDLS